MGFNFTYFEIEESLGLVWVKLQKGHFTCRFPIRVFKRCSFQVWTLFLLILCIKKVLTANLGKNCRKIHFKISILVLVSQVMVFHFVHFGYKKDFWHILIKFIVYRVSLSSSRSHKKPFQLVDLVIGHL